MLYRLEPLLSKEVTIWVKENDDQVKRYFLWDADDGSFLDASKVQFEVHGGMTSEEVQAADFLQVESDMLVLSTRAYEALEKQLKKEVEFHPCDVFCEGKRFDFYIGRIVLRKPLVNREKSTYWNLEGGVTILQNVVYTELEEDFLLARDAENGNYYAASEDFMNLVKAQRLQIKGIPLQTTLGKLFG